MKNLMTTKTSVVRSSLLVLSGVYCASMMIACAPESPRLMAPPVKYGVTSTESKPVVVNVAPKVDILMVVDNSDSMVDEQQTLSNNIDKFADGVAANSGIDFHIGVVSVWDTAMFKDMKKEYGHGELRRLKDPKGANLPETFGRFVSSKENYDSYLAQAGFSLGKEPGWKQVLRASMKIGVESYNPKWAEEKTGGPEVEEIFSPVKAALSEPMASAANKDFRRKDAHFVVIFITDADASVRDSNGNSFDLTSGELQEFLRSQMGENYRDEVTVLGALAKSTDDPKERDPAIRYASRGPTEPVNILNFIRDLGGKRMGLRGSSYGKEMSELGKYVRERTLSRPRVDLDALPEQGTLKVSLNGEDMVAGPNSWQYDDSRNGIIITRDLSGVNGTIDIKVGFTPVSAISLKSGRITKVGGR